MKRDELFNNVGVESIYFEMSLTLSRSLDKGSCTASAVDVYGPFHIHMGEPYVIAQIQRQTGKTSPSIIYTHNAVLYVYITTSFSTTLKFIFGLSIALSLSYVNHINIYAAHKHSHIPKRRVIASLKLIIHLSAHATVHIPTIHIVSILSKHPPAIYLCVYSRPTMRILVIHTNVGDAGGGGHREDGRGGRVTVGVG